MCFSCRYSTQDFDDALFTEYRVIKPPSLSNAVTKRKAEFLAGRVCARHALEEMGQIGDVPIGCNRQPVWPENVVGSISHTNQTAIAIVAKQDHISALGIDIEHTVDAKTGEDMISQIINDDERAFIQKNGQLDREMLTMIFSAKESFFKAAYPSIQSFFGFDAISLRAISTHTLQFEINRQLGDAFVKNTPIEIEFAKLNKNHIVTYCVL